MLWSVALEKDSIWDFHMGNGIVWYGVRVVTMIGTMIQAEVFVDGKPREFIFNGDHVAFTVKVEESNEQVQAVDGAGVDGFEEASG